MSGPVSSWNRPALRDQFPDRRWRQSLSSRLDNRTAQGTSPTLQHSKNPTISDTQGNDATKASETAEEPQSLRKGGSCFQDYPVQKTPDVIYSGVSTQGGASLQSASDIGTETKRRGGPEDESNTQSCSSHNDDAVMVNFIPDHAPTVHTLHDNPECDIDTETGVFLPSVKYPETLAYRPAKPDKKSWKYFSVTASQIIERKMRSRTALANDRLKHKAASEEVLAAQPNPSDSAWPLAECDLRPVEEVDYEAIAHMINLASREPEPQVIERADVVSGDVAELHAQCRRDHRPFIVAVAKRGSMPDPRKWPAGAEKEYEEFYEFKRQQAAQTRSILGLAFFAEMQHGLLGIGSSWASRHSAKVRVLVHPEHRRKKYGYALFDRILRCAVAWTSRIDYGWVCDDPVRIYEPRPRENARQYIRLYVEFFVSGKAEQEQQWRTRLLNDLGFKQVSRFQKAARTNDIPMGQWLDLVLFALDTQNDGDIYN